MRLVRLVLLALVAALALPSVAAASSPTYVFLDAPMAPVVHGSAITYSASVQYHESPGTVAFSVDGSTIRSCARLVPDSWDDDVSCATLAPVTAGTHTLTAAYSGTPDRDPSSRSVTFDVTAPSLAVPGAALHLGTVDVSSHGAIGGDVWIQQSDPTPFAIPTSAIAFDQPAVGFSVGGERGLFRTGCSMPAGSGCRVSVAYDPGIDTPAGLKTAQLRITPAAGALPVFVTVSAMVSRDPSLGYQGVRAVSTRMRVDVDRRGRTVLTLRCTLGGSWCKVAGDVVVRGKVVGTLRPLKMAVGRVLRVGVQLTGHPTGVATLVLRTAGATFQHRLVLRRSR